MRNALLLNAAGRLRIACAMFALAFCVGELGSRAKAADWLTLPSTYTHDANGQRVSQYAPPVASYAVQVSNFRSSGYTHARSSLQYGPSADNYHRVEEWGDPVRPYGEWRFPYRPYSQPYSAWGPPLAGLGGLGWGGGYGYGYGPSGPNGGGAGNRPGGEHGNRPGQDGAGGQANPGNPYPSLPGTGYDVPPQYDGHYPSTPYRPRLNDRDFYRDPRSRP
ncbi:hypothetical protein [Roseimaritima ulvae]|nr:hypothetical protein [Roseimaritima ulvae]